LTFSLIEILYAYGCVVAFTGWNGSSAGTEGSNKFFTGKNGRTVTPDGDIQKLIEGYSCPDNLGRYTPFWAAVIYTLQSIVTSGE
jgi:hypothetical protein